MTWADDFEFELRYRVAHAIDVLCHGVPDYTLPEEEW